MSTTQELDDRVVERELRAIRDSVFASIERSATVKRRARIGISIAAVLVVAGGTTAGAIAIRAASAQVVANSVVCYQDDSTASRSQASGQASEAWKNGKRVALPAADFLGMCQLAWRSGALGNVTPAADPNKGTYPVPAIAFCTGDNGIAAGFPNRDGLTDARLCSIVGLPVWPSQASGSPRASATSSGEFEAGS